MHDPRPPSHRLGSARAAGAVGADAGVGAVTALKRPLSPPAPKPCPRCYAPMHSTPEGFACERHGIPEPLLKREPIERSRRKPSVVRQPKVRKPRTIRFPSDLKEYPLPPSPDGRSNNRTSRESPTTARSRLTPALLERVIAAAKTGQTPWQIAGEIWEEAGYSSRHACKGSIYRALAATEPVAEEAGELTREKEASG
jgi:hypothetical protein